LINLIKEKINSSTDPIVVVDFNPWLIGSLESVIESFLIQLAASINHTFKSDIANKASKGLLEFAKYLAPIKLIPGVEPWGTIVEGMINSIGGGVKTTVDLTPLDINKRKQAVRKAIQDIDRPIVVIIDDIDRCPPAEVRIVFQVIKAICDFDRVSYLLAYDPEPIIKCMEYDGTYNGKLYLEKIVQASYPLPRIGYWHLKTYLNKHLLDLQNRLNIKLSAQEKECLHEALDTTAIVRSLSTPRDVIRLINRLLISLINIKDEVNLADVISFETLELKYPQISRAIRISPEIFIGASIIEGDSITQDYMDTVSTKEDNKAVTDKYIDSLLEDCDIKDKKNIRSILNFLFPKLFGEWTPYSPQAAAYNNRISNREALLKLLHSGQTKFVYSSREIKHFLESDIDRKEVLIDFLETGNICEWLGYVESFIPQSEMKNPFGLCADLLFIGNVSFNDKGINVTDVVSAIILDIIYATANPVDKLNLLAIISTNEHSLSISEHVILRLLQKCGMWENGIYYGIKRGSERVDSKLGFELKRLVDVKDAWINTLKESITKKYIFHVEPEPISILFRWGQLNDNNFADVKIYISNEIQDGERLKDFLNLFNEGKGLSGIEKMIDVSQFLEKLATLTHPPPAAAKFISYFNALEKPQE
jgi:hypothetical protein